MLLLLVREDVQLLPLYRRDFLPLCCTSRINNQ
jgi:hypothetical protein